MAVLDAIYAPELGHRQLLGLASYFLEGVRTGNCAPVLITYQLAGRLVALGRYHLYGGPEERAGVGAYRRLTGGRIAGGGRGWIGCALILPNRGALLREKISDLKPEQVINRYVRGVLNGLRELGVDCFYPGRDAITHERREIGICSFETDYSGALLFETIVAVSGGLEALVYDLELLDPDGVLTCPMYSADLATTLARELNRDVAPHELAQAIEAGYEGLFGDLRRRKLTSTESIEADQRGGALAASQWLTARKCDPSLGLVGRERIQLGFIEAHLALNRAGMIDRLMIAGDFIANSGGIDDFERELTGKRPDMISLTGAAARIFGDGRNYILGVGDLSNLTRAIMKAS